MTGMDCIRLSRNFAFMARTLEGKTDNDMIKAGQSVLQHHFDNHQCCGDWCRRKTESKEERARKQHFYRSKAKDNELYEELQQILRRFITLDALKEVAHSMDTCANESLNNTISWVAPKNKSTAVQTPLQYALRSLLVSIHLVQETIIKSYFD